MFRIRRRHSRQAAGQVDPELRDPIALRYVARSVLSISRFLHKWRDQLVRMYSHMPASDKAVYQPFIEQDLQPSFEQLLGLIAHAQEHGIISFDEAASLRAGQDIPIADLPTKEPNRDGHTN